jgi:hypothetical protein
MTVFFDSPGLCHGSIAPPTLAPPGELCEKRSVSLKESVVRWSVSIGRGKPYCCACVMLHITNFISKITDIKKPSRHSAETACCRDRFRVATREVLSHWSAAGRIYAFDFGSPHPWYRSAWYRQEWQGTISALRPQA